MPDLDRTATARRRVGSDAAGRVLVYRSSLLVASETFVLAQVLALRRWSATLVGEARVPGVILPTDLPTVVLGAGRARWWRRLQRRVARGLGRAPARDVRVLQACRANLLHAHFATDGVDIAPLARALGLPLVVTLHGFDIHTRATHWRSGAGGRGMRDYPDRLRALLADPMVHVVAVSEDVARAARESGVDPQRLRTLPIGVDTDFWRPGPVPMPDRARRVLFVGRLVEKKGLTHLLQALALPALAGQGVELVVIGEGPLAQPLQAQARAKGVDARFLGACDSRRVRQELHAARVLCLPSVTDASGDAEGFGLVLLEAQACGVPVVTSARGGRDQGLLDGVSGHAVPEADPAALADALAPLLADAARAQRMGEAGRQFVQTRLDIDHCTRALEDWYTEIVEAHR